MTKQYDIIAAGECLVDFVSGMQTISERSRKVNGQFPKSAGTAGGTIPTAATPANLPEHPPTPADTRPHVSQCFWEHCLGLRFVSIIRIWQKIRKD